MTLRVDGSSGHIDDSFFIYAPAGTRKVGFLLNGAVLDPASSETSVAYTGFMFNSQFDGIEGVGRHVSFSIDYSDNLSVNWQQAYLPEFSVGNYEDVIFDFIAQPINYGATFYGNDSNNYYQPKGLLLDGDKMVFTGVSQQTLYGAFELDLYRTTLTGKVECNCTFPLDLELYYPINIENGTNYSNLNSPYTVSSPGAGLFGSPFEANLSCTQANYCTAAPRTLGIGELEKQDIKAYPNPVRDHLFVTGLEDFSGARAALYDLQGRRVLEQPLTGGQPMINVSALAQGIYFLRVTMQGKELLTEKVITE